MSEEFKIVPSATLEFESVEDSLGRGRCSAVRRLKIGDAVMIPIKNPAEYKAEVAKIKQSVYQLRKEGYGIEVRVVKGKTAVAMVKTKDPVPK